MKRVPFIAPSWKRENQRKLAAAAQRAGEIAARICPVPGCGRKIQSIYLMCPSHWASVPHRLQREVLTAWRALRSEDPGARQRYITAKYAAIESVTLKPQAQ